MLKHRLFFSPDETGGAGQGANDPAPIPYARFKEVNDAKIKLESDLGALRAQFDKSQSDLNALATKAHTDSETLTASLTATKNDLSVAQLRALRLEVGVEKVLPLEFINRLSGATKEEMAADADKLLPLLKPLTPGTPRGGGGEPAPLLDLSKMSPAEIRKANAEGKLLNK